MSSEYRKTCETGCLQGALQSLPCREAGRDGPLSGLEKALGEALAAFVREQVARELAAVRLAAADAAASAAKAVDAARLAGEDARRAAGCREDAALYCYRVRVMCEDMAS